jgi:hypothetical protein
VIAITGLDVAPVRRAAENGAAPRKSLGRGANMDVTIASLLRATAP